jgi:hypothetical protein
MAGVVSVRGLARSSRSTYIVYSPSGVRAAPREGLPAVLAVRDATARPDGTPLPAPPAGSGGAPGVARPAPPAPVQSIGTGSRLRDRLGRFR